MQISPSILLAVLGAAVLHAAWNALFKSSPDKALENLALAVGRGTLALACLPWLPLPAPASWPWGRTFATGPSEFSVGKERFKGLVTRQSTTGEKEMRAPANRSPRSR